MHKKKILAALLIFGCMPLIGGLDDSDPYDGIEMGKKQPSTLMLPFLKEENRGIAYGLLDCLLQVIRACSPTKQHDTTKLEPDGDLESPSKLKAD